MEGTQLTLAHLEQANLWHAHLINVQLVAAHLEGTRFNHTYLLEEVFLDRAILVDKKGIGPRLADAYWENVHLAVVNWSQMKMLGDEYKARLEMDSDGKKKSKVQKLNEYETAVRANRQLAVVLQAQGLNEDAARFAYRSQMLQKRVFWFQILQKGAKLRQRVRALGSWLFSWFLYLLAGYGYRPFRSFLAYLFVIAGFATVYYLLGLSDVGPHHILGSHYLTWYGAIVVSMTAFHGRGFFAGTFQPGDPQAFVAALEALVGLIIEVTFIATLTRRLFGQ